MTREVRAAKRKAAIEKMKLRLTARIAGSYQTVTESLSIGGLTLPFTRITDPDRVLDQVAEAIDRRERQTGKRQSDPQHLPYWAELWESARALGAFMVGMWGSAAAVGLDAPLNGHLTAQKTEVSKTTTTARPHIAPSPRRTPTSILDLGCGMGLAGTVAAALGARVLFADLEPPALLFARLNSLAYAGRVRTRQLNWQKDQLTETFDVILGADILYERPQWESLDAFWRAHLKPTGQILLGEPGRQTGDLFIDWARARGWMFDQHEVPVAGRPRPVRIFELRFRRI